MRRWVGGVLFRQGAPCLFSLDCGGSTPLSFFALPQTDSLFAVSALHACRAKKDSENRCSFAFATLIAFLTGPDGRPADRRPLPPRTSAGSAGRQTGVIRTFDEHKAAPHEPRKS